MKTIATWCRYSTSSPTRPEGDYIRYSKRIADCFSLLGRDAAMEIALEWAALVCENLRLPRPSVWKVFKRSLVAKWFGAPERRVFAPVWDPQAVIDYAAGFPTRNVRISSFEPDIACRSDSICLEPTQRQMWGTFMTPLNREVLIEVFPESSTPLGICFRRFGTAFSEEVSYEAGIGQAMYVWEAAQGEHPLVSVSRFRDRALACNRMSPNGATAQLDRIEATLKTLIDLHDQSFRSSFFTLCRRTGIECFAIEGYFDPTFPQRVVVVDMDLPFDYAFMGA